MNRLGLLVCTVSAVAPERMHGALRQVSDGEWLSDRPELIVAQGQSWGVLGIDTSAHPPGQTPLPLEIGAHHYAKGLGSHANGEIVIDLGGEYARFEAEIGVQRQEGTLGSVVFQAFADDELLYTSPILHPTDAAVAVSVALGGRAELRLVATDAGDGITCDCADWAAARLVRAAPATRVTQRSPTDVAPFAAVRSWNWKDREGTRAGRLDTFPVADLRPFTELARDAGGSFAVAAADGWACIGLEWFEPRRLARLELELEPRLAGEQPGRDPSADPVRVEQWSAPAGAGSTWQGRWEPVRGEVRVEGERFVLEPRAPDDPGLLSGSMKIRWIVPVPPRSAEAETKALRVRALRAFSRSRWQDVELELTLDAAHAGPRASIGIYNGVVQDVSLSDRAHPGGAHPGGAHPGGADEPIAWDSRAPLRLALSSCATRHARGDRTVLRFELPQMSFGIAVEDVLAHGGVWVPDAGLYVSDARKPLSLAEYRRRFDGQQTVLESVRARPDQTLEAAMARLHQPVQDLGPTLISLPADNRKFILERDGTLRWDDRAEIVDCVDRQAPEPYRCTALVRFGERREPATERQLVDLSCLQLELGHRAGAVQYSMQALVTPPATGELWLAAENTGNEAAPILFDLRFAHPAGVRVHVGPDGRTAVAEADGHVFAWVTPGPGAAIETSADACLMRATLTAHARVSGRVVIPRWRATPADLARVPDARAAKADAQRAWQVFLAEMAQIEVPDRQIDRILHASVLHCLAAARSSVVSDAEPDVGARIAPWIASIAYGPLESEAQSVIRGCSRSERARSQRRPCATSPIASIRMAA